MEELSQQTLEESRHLLEELYAEVKRKVGYLGEGQVVHPGLEALEKLRQTTVLFGDPYNYLHQLTPEMFEALNLLLDPIQRQQLAGSYEFYYMTLTTPHADPFRGGIPAT